MASLDLVQATIAGGVIEGGDPYTIADIAHAHLHQQNDFGDSLIRVCKVWVTNDIGIAVRMMEIWDFEASAIEAMKSEMKGDGISLMFALVVSRPMSAPDRPAPTPSKKSYIH